MEKLIDLLNEYEQLNMCRKFDSFELHTFENSSGVDRLLEDTVISARYGFIKWLVENDKIDKKKIDTRLVRNVESHYDEDGYWVENSYEDYSNTDTLLMLLSISDTPIEDLISYLK